MTPFASIGAGLGITLLQKWWEKRQAEKAAQALPPPPDFTPAQMNYFTRALPEEGQGGGQGRFRAFSVDTNHVTLMLLGARSAVPVKHESLQQYGQVWRVVPLQAGAPTALDVIQAAHRDPNQVVVGSLSLVLLPIGSPAPMILVVGPPSAQMLTVREGVIAQPDGTKPAGAFAVLTPVVTPEVEAPAPAPAPPVEQVGAAGPAPEPAPVEVPAEVVTTTAPPPVDPPSRKNGRGSVKIEPAIVAEHTVTTEK